MNVTIYGADRMPHASFTCQFSQPWFLHMYRPLTDSGECPLGARMPMKYDAIIRECPEVNRNMCPFFDSSTFDRPQEDA